MLTYMILLVFLTALQIGSSNPQHEKSATESHISRIKKNEVSANGIENYSEILKNFRNPVLEYLFSKNKDVSMMGPKKGIVREIRHTQTLMLPNFWKEFWPSTGVRPPPSDSFNTVLKIPKRHLILNSNHSSLDDLGEHIKNEKTETLEKSIGHTIKSQVLHVNANPNEGNDDLAKIQVYPAVGVSINTFGKDGVLKSTLTHFQPDLHLANIAHNQKEAFFLDGPSNAEINRKNYQNNLSNYFYENNSVKSQKRNKLWEMSLLNPAELIAPRNPFMNFQNLLSTSVYNTASSIIEYDLKEDKKESSLQKKEVYGLAGENNFGKTQQINDLNEKAMTVVESLTSQQQHQKFSTEDFNIELPSKNFHNQAMQKEEIFDEVTMKSNVFNKIKKKMSINVDENIGKNENEKFGVTHLRNKRDSTSVLLKTRHGDQIALAIEEPVRNEQNKRKSTGGDLIIRKGGIAIAGPWGAATAYTGGTAIVGPYGTVYKSPEGVAIVGPYSKIINITDDTSFEDILKMHRKGTDQSQNPNRSQYQNQNDKTRFKNFRNNFSYITDLPVKIEMKSPKKNVSRNQSRIARLKESDVMKVIEKMRNEGFKKILEETQFEEKLIKENETTLIFSPKSKAEAGKSGVAVSTPISHAILLPGQKPKIYFEPESVASAGPLGLAHAHSDLFVSYLDNNTAAINSHAHAQDLKAILQSKINH